MHVVRQQNDTTTRTTIWIFSLSSSADIVYVFSYMELLEGVQQLYAVSVRNEPLKSE